MQQEIYLDNSATTRPYDEVTTLMGDLAANTYGNPSSLHTKGIEAERRVNTARETIAATLFADKKEIIFTSGGTESNNLAIRGYLDANPRRGKHIITTKTEHPSVLEVYHHLENQGWRVDYIGVDEKGALDLDEFKGKLDQETALVSILLVNNETGAIQQLERISAIRDRVNPQTVIHADAVQAYGKMTIHPEKLGVGLLSVSSHKIHGPKGVGALYVSKKVRIKPLFFGGGQEALLRSGTENVPGIAGFGLAADRIHRDLSAGMEKISSLKNAFIAGLAESEIDHQIISPEDASPYILKVAFDDIRGEVLLHHLEQKGIFVSTGSACSSHKNTRSHVLTAMGIPNQLIDGAIRFSFSPFNSLDEIQFTVEMIKEVIPMIKIHKKPKMRRQQ